MPWFGRDERRRAAEQIKAVKWRQWVLMPSISVTIAALVINTIVIITALDSFANYSNDDTGKFSFYDLPDGLIRSKVVTAVSLEVVLLAVLWAETLYFAVFFHRDDRVHRRCVIQASLSIVLIVLAVVLKVIVDELVAIPSTFDTSTTKRPELTAEQFSAAYSSWQSSIISDPVLIVFAVAVTDAAIHAIVLVFWLWLLPARHRLPNRYEPVIEPKKRKRVVGSSARSSYELVNTTDSSVNSGPLEVVFREHERARLSNRINSSNTSQKPVKETYSASLSSCGPQFDPIVRYWMVNPLRDGAWPVTAVFIVFFFVDPVLEIVFYSLTKTHGLRCSWYCYLSFAYPWPIVLWMAIIVVLLRMKMPFNRRIFGKGPRLDVLLTITALPFIPVWFLVHITRFAEFSLDSGKDYQDYIDSDPGRSSAYGVISALKILEVSFAIILGICLSIMGHTLYRFYTAGRNSSMSQRSTSQMT
ncbi:hypothetical protein GGR55DRAFT_334098 [Xylaria sp. FL0064]|nr:hypothetical protein GGR55DRAFT_334098 [Xylaria sp. FL0064]